MRERAQLLIESREFTLGNILGLVDSSMTPAGNCLIEGVCAQ